MVDAAGSGLYQRPDGSRYFADHENPEERWIRSMAEDAERAAEEHERQEDLERSRAEELDDYDPNMEEHPWRRIERPAGLMLHYPEESHP